MLSLTKHHVCRCCLRENTLVTYDLCADGADNMRTILLRCVPNLNIEPDSRIPNTICDICALRVREMYEFMKMCEKNEDDLRRRYDDTNRAIEEVLKWNNLEHFDMELIKELDVDSVKEQQRELSVDANSMLLQNTTEPEDAIFNDLLLDDCNLDTLLDVPIQNGHLNEDDPAITELLDEVLSDPNFLNDMTSENLTNSAKDISSIDDNQSCYVEEEIFIEGKQNSTTTDPAPPKECSRSRIPKSLHPCPECEKKFTRNFQLKLHLISVHNIGDGLQYQCQDCQKTFASSHGLKYHQKSTHSLERPFACGHCDRRFVLRTQLSSHQRMHTGETKPRIFECMDCGKLWPTQSDLRTHMRSHNPQNVRPFKCDKCAKCFYTRGHLSSHQLVHTGEKPFLCVFCEKSYQSVGNLNNHMVRHHADLLMKNNPMGSPLEI